ncbi:sterol desaturase family protein [Seohaeicola nanhaiensis]|uniref:Sterol desaturase family protein n=1 Tax=Seohaeicola nanhaiensis TaxID=1387282 RepID=A0ABV9KMV9_9RHOB
MFLSVLQSLSEAAPKPVWYAVGALLILLLILLRYAVLSSAGYSLGLALGRWAPWRRLQPRPFSSAQISREIRDSVVTVIVFTGIVGLIILMKQAGLTAIYDDPLHYGAVWLVLQIPVALLIHDWYFYWMHRLVHRPPFFEPIHRTHHLSTNPSAFAAFAFHPFEAILEIAVFVPLVMVMPMYSVCLLAASLVSLSYNVYGHLGYEIMPRWLAATWLGRLLNKSAYHNQHHRTFRYNFGLYTVIWDRLHGTLHPEAEQLYDRATRRPDG